MLFYPVLLDLQPNFDRVYSSSPGLPECAAVARWKVDVGGVILFVLSSLRQTLKTDEHDIVPNIEHNIVP